MSKTNRVFEMSFKRLINCMAFIKYMRSLLVVKLKLYFLSTFFFKSDYLGSTSKFIFLNIWV